MFWERILQTKAVEVKRKKDQTPLVQLEKRLTNAPATRPFRSRLIGERLQLIAEIKQASPAKGVLCPDFQPVWLAQTYEASGAAALSVLTDENFFRGSLTDLEQVKKETKKLPVLRKDFIIDPYQIYEARVYGADAVLFIVAALTRAQLKSFIETAQNLGLDVLVEVHNFPELTIALEAGAELIGINNRDLKTFAVNLETTFRLLETIPQDKVVVAESGIKNAHQIKRLAQAGVHAVLIGEALVTAADPGAKIEELIGGANGSG
ncbi:MAG: indole-3-glycerol phosphate synthase TrpC [Firmicutes bacterium]|nr:indole-3-glycerol phosphate synthase TrpC [Bacillota bacterium]